MNNKSNKGIVSNVIIVVLVLIIVALIGINVFYILTGSNTETYEINSTSTNNYLNISYIVATVKDQSSEAAVDKQQQINDKEVFNYVNQVINDAEICNDEELLASINGGNYPTLEIHLSNDECIYLVAGDKLGDDGNTNLILRWNQNDKANKTLYKTDLEMGAYIEGLFVEEQVSE